MRQNNVKKYFSIVAAVTIIGAIGVGSTLAYFTDNSSKTNVFTTGDLDLGLHETLWNPEKGDGNNMYPGYTVYKNPTVKNITSDKNGEEPCYVRVNVEILDQNDQEITNGDALSLIYKTIYYDSSFTGKYDQTGGKATGLVEGKKPGYNLTELSQYPMVNPHWTKDTTRSTASKLVFNYMGEDGDGILDIGEESTLFTNIVIPTDWNQTQLTTVGAYKLKITAQAIQSKGFATQSDAFLMLDEEVQGGTLQEIVRGTE